MTPTEQRENKIEALVDELEKALVGVPNYAVAYQIVSTAIDQAHKDGLRRAALFLEGRAKEFERGDSIASQVMANIYREEARTIRGLD